MYRGLAIFRSVWWTLFCSKCRDVLIIANHYAHLYIMYVFRRNMEKGMYTFKMSQKRVNSGLTHLRLCVRCTSLWIDIAAPLIASLMFTESHKCLQIAKAWSWTPTGGRGTFPSPSSLLKAAFWSAKQVMSCTTPAPDTFSYQSSSFSRFRRFRPDLRRRAGMKHCIVSSRFARFVWSIFVELLLHSTKMPSCRQQFAMTSGLKACYIPFYACIAE